MRVIRRLSWEIGIDTSSNVSIDTKVLSPLTATVRTVVPMNRRTSNACSTGRIDRRRFAGDSLLQAGEEPPLASHLVTPRALYSHHGIYAGNGRVIHYAGLAHGLRRGPVESVSLEEFARGRCVRVRHDAARFDHSEVLERARSRLGERRYRVMTNNCEHFCAWALQGESHSPQVERMRATPRALHLWLAALLLSALCAPLMTSAEDEHMVQLASTATERLPVEGRMPSLDSAITWLNSPPLTAAGLRGKVVLVDFWTYTCINWLRTLPYVRAWAEKYKDQGLVVIGVHTPEFSFEKDLDNVRWAAKELKVDYPIAVDSDYAIWDAFSNRYWPALYFIDAQGRIRHHQFGEGDYEQSERIIQQLLAEAGRTPVDRDLVPVAGRGAEAAADWNSLRSPETYVGYGRSEGFASPGEALLERSRVYAAPARLRLNEWALSGDWTVKRETAALNKAAGRITFRFHARDLHLIMSLSARGTPVRFRVLLDGKPPGESHGVDVDDEGRGSVVEPRMYQLIRQPAPIADRQFEIEFLDAGAQVFAFTFG